MGRSAFATDKSLMAWNFGGVHSDFNLDERIWRSSPQRANLKVHYAPIPKQWQLGSWNFDLSPKDRRVCYQRFYPVYFLSCLPTVSCAWPAPAVDTLLVSKYTASRVIHVCKWLYSRLHQRLELGKSGENGASLLGGEILNWAELGQNRCFSLLKVKYYITVWGTGRKFDLN